MGRPSTRWARGCRSSCLASSACACCLIQTFCQKFCARAIWTTRAAHLPTGSMASQGKQDVSRRRGNRAPSAGRRIQGLHERLGRRHCRVKSASWTAFEKSACRRRSNVGSSRCFAVYKIAAPGSPVRGRRGDRYDRAYLGAGRALGARKFGDRIVALASNDRRACAAAEWLSRQVARKDSRYKRQEVSRAP